MPHFGISAEIGYENGNLLYEQLCDRVFIYLLCCLAVSIEVCDSLGSSKLQWRGGSQAAACVPSETSDTRQKRGLRVPKHERRAMVESFVNKYFLCFF